MSNLIKTSGGTLIKYTKTYETCEGFTTSKPLPQSSMTGLSGISLTTSQYYGKEVKVTNGDEIAIYRANSNGSFTSVTLPKPVTTDAILISGSSGLSPSYAGKYYLRSTQTWSDKIVLDTLIKIN